MGIKGVRDFTLFDIAPVYVGHRTVSRRIRPASTGNTRSISSQLRHLFLSRSVRHFEGDEATQATPGLTAGGRCAYHYGRSVILDQSFLVAKADEASRLHAV